MTLYILEYNNYYNRIVKKEDSLSAYLEYVLGTYEGIINWNPNDGVNTTQVLNHPVDEGDYLLVVDDTNTIVSRWFIVESTRLRNGQYQLTLVRDVMVDYYDNIINAPAFIEKATVVDIDDPAIYNSEDMTFNQIKQQEILLKDPTKCAWVVGYIPRDSFPKGQEITVEIPSAGSADITVNGLSNYEYYQYVDKNITSLSNVTYRVKTRSEGSAAQAIGQTAYYHVYFNFDMNSNPITEQINFLGLSNLSGDEPAEYRTTPLKTPDNTVIYDLGFTYLSPTGNEIKNRIANGYKPHIDMINSALNSGSGLVPTSTLEDIRNDNGKVLYDSSTGNYYKISVTQVDSQTDYTQDVIQGSRLFNLLDMYLDTTDIILQPDGTTFSVQGYSQTYTIVLELLTETVKVNIGPSRYHLEDSPYDMFAIPYPVDEAITIYQDGAVLTSDVRGNAAVQIAVGIPPAAGSATIYDIQLLPYCPVSYVITADNKIDVGSTVHSNITDEDGNVLNVLFWGRTSQRSFNIPVELPVKTNVVDKKVQSLTKKYRLCSPNYASASDFNVAMNDGVEYVNVDLNYKPYNPYIHLNINYKNLYGSDFNDVRGLICGGDYSLPQVSSAWADYQLSNKNYLAVFDRQIENMEVNNAVQKERERWQVVAGTFSAGVSGGLAGSMSGNPYIAAGGAVLGAGLGAGVSAAAGVRDIQLNNLLRNEAIDYAKDQFGYQLGNIQAIPQGLSKTSSITINNKYFPFIEVYGCTQTEENALRSKLQYNGMTIMRISSISNFLHSTQTYIKAKLIRLEGLNCDTNLLNYIASEMYKGVFI